MKTLLLGIGLIMLLTMSLGCDEDNNVIAQEPEIMDPESMPEAMTMITGKVIAPGNQCDGRIDGFNNGDEVMIEMNGGGDAQPNGKVTNMTTGNSIGCGGDSGLNDNPLISALGCITVDSQISSFKNSDFMTILVDYSWIQSFKEDITKSAYVLNQNIEFVEDQDLQKAPCVRVMIETITAAGP